MERGSGKTRLLCLSDAFCTQLELSRVPRRDARAVSGADPSEVVELTPNHCV